MRRVSSASVSMRMRKLAGVPGWRGLAALSSASSASSLSAFESNVGNTRLVRLKRASELAGCDVLGKCEYENPGGSIKDRAALAMLKDAEARGVLRRGEPGIVIEGTAGNTGIGLALACRVAQYKCVICIARTQSEEKKQTLRLAGAQLVEVDAVPYKNPNNYVHVAKRLAESLRKESGLPVLYADQWDNPANRRAHTESTGPEVLQQALAMTGRLDAFSCAMGTGGTLTGVAEFLRAEHPSAKIGLTDPAGAALFRYFRDGALAAEGSSITEGIGQGRITGNMESFKPDLLHEIDDHEMITTLYDLLEHDGLALGGSAAINVAGAIRIGKQLGPGHTVATVLCDLGQRYASKLYNASFLASKGLPVAPWLLDADAQRKEDPAFFGMLDKARADAILL